MRVNDSQRCLRRGSLQQQSQLNVACTHTFGKYRTVPTYIVTTFSYCSRLALVLAGLEFEDERISFDQWKDFKPQTPFGQLPVLQIDDGPLRTQAHAMLRWIGSQNKSLYPDNDYAVDEAMGVVEDMRQSWTPCLALKGMPGAYGHDPEALQGEAGTAKVKKVREYWMKERLPGLVKQVEQLLSRNENKWVASKDSPTIADCLLVPFLRSFTRGHVDHVPTTIWDDYPVLKDYVKRFCALDAVKGRYTDGLHE